MSAEDRRNLLRADCANCHGLCCVALPFGASADFPVDKRAGEPCGHLRPDFRCGIHETLRGRGYRGCTVFDCFGAGQHVSRRLFPDTDWRRDPESAQRMFAVFDVVRRLNELRWHLAELLTIEPARGLHEDARRLRTNIEDLLDRGADEIAGADVPALRAAVGELLTETSDLVRAAAGGGPNHRDADLIGARLRGADLCGANLRGAYLIVADLRGADLRAADLLGADLRDADVRGTDLSETIFLTQVQVNAAKGDGRTTLPAALDRPAHWSPATDPIRDRP